MKIAPVVVIAVGSLIAWRAYVAYQQTYGTEAEAGALTDGGWLPSADDILSGATQAIDTMTGGFMNISAMRGVDRALINNANVRAVLAVIRTGEGTTDANGYRRIFGGELVSSFADHPRKVVKLANKKTGKVYESSASGAYQAKISTWDETAKMMSLPDFSPASQDLFALGRMAARRALDDIVAGRFDSAIRKLRQEWASMPGDFYGQGGITMAQAQQVYTANGGAIA